MRSRLGRLRQRWLELFSVVWLTACSDPVPLVGSAGASAAATGLPSTATIAESVFAQGPLQLQDLTVTRRTGSGYELNVRAKAVVAQAGTGRVVLPIRAVCRFGEQRVVAFSELVGRGGPRVSLEKVRSSELDLQTPASFGWLGEADGCELLFRLEPIGQAKEASSVLEERFCFEGGGLRAGACAWAPLTPPSTKQRLHDVQEEPSDGKLRLRAHLQTRDAKPARGIVAAEARCGEAAPLRETELLPEQKVFALAAGESTAFTLELFRKTPRPAGRCSVRFEWSAWEGAEAPKPEPPLELGTWCVEDGKATEGACQ
jgi:hypothetical protein